MKAKLALITEQLLSDLLCGKVTICLPDDAKARILQYRPEYAAYDIRYESDEYPDTPEGSAMPYEEFTYRRDGQDGVYRST